MKKFIVVIVRHYIGSDSIRVESFAHAVEAHRRAAQFRRTEWHRGNYTVRVFFYGGGDYNEWWTTA